MIATLKTENSEIQLSGRTLAIVLDLAKIQDEINHAEKGQIEIHFKGREFSTFFGKLRKGKVPMEAL